MIESKFKKFCENPSHWFDKQSTIKNNSGWCLVFILFISYGFS